MFAIDVGCLKKAFVKYNNISDGEIEEYLNQFLDKYVSVIVPLNDVMDYRKYNKLCKTSRTKILFYAR